ncbi:LuxR C-terminal-related transcriptional regulator [Saccharopolyspora cebuensis]|uniref:LuxR C-terminal-related transcriptional regulator n=1 Tax=Saccharopolyspora cebuensis TaxID=418759 RepID=A0ABV4CE10_9PSEU
MGREQVAVEGRDGVLAALRDAPRAGAGRGRLVVLRGPAGIGKTRLMEAVARRWRGDGTRVIDVRLGGSAAGRSGFGAVLDALRRDFTLLGEPALVDRIGALSRVCAREGGPGWSSAVVAGCSEVFDRIGALGPTAVLVDDATAVADPLLPLLAARRPGCLVLTSVREEAAPTAAGTELFALADDVLDLEPLTGEDIAAVTGDELDGGVHRALRAALGPLYGNPGAVLATVARLRERGRLIGAGDRLVLADPAEAIALPGEHHLPRRVRELGDLGARMLATTAALGGLGVEELPLVAEALGEDLFACGRTVDRLVELGALTGETWDRVVCLCPALAAWAAAEDPAAVRRLRAERVTGARTFAPGTARPVARDDAASAPSLTRTESRIVELVSDGLTNRRIGSELNLSEKTVEGYLTRLFARTGCRSRVELVAANLRGSLDPGAAHGLAA